MQRSKRIGWRWGGAAVLLAFGLFATLLSEHGERSGVEPLRPREPPREEPAPGPRASLELRPAQPVPDAPDTSEVVRSAPHAGRTPVATRPSVSGRIEVEGGYPRDTEAVVVAAALSGARITSLRESWVDPDGRFRVELPARVQSASLSLRSELLQAPERRVEVGDQDVVLKAVRLARVQGRLGMDSTWEDVTPLMIQLRLAGKGYVSSLAEPDGTFLLPQVQPGIPLEILVEWVGGERSGVLARDFLPGLLQGETATVELPLPSVSRLRGAVTDRSGAPVDGARVQVRRLSGSDEGLRQQATTDAEGTFDLGDLPLGAWTLTAGKAGHSTLQRALEVSLDRTELALVLDAGWIVRGRVVGPDGVGVESARVTARSGPGTLETLSGPAGAFLLEVTPGLLEITASDGLQSRSRPLYLRSPPDLVSELTLALRPVGGVRLRAPQVGRVQLVHTNGETFEGTIEGTAALLVPTGRLELRTPEGVHLQWIEVTEGQWLEVEPHLPHPMIPFPRDGASNVATPGSG